MYGPVIYPMSMLRSMLPIVANGIMRIVRKERRIETVKRTQYLTKNYLTFTSGVVNFNDYAASRLYASIDWKSKL